MSVVDCKYPKIKVRLSGENGNAYSILGRVRRAMLKGGVPESEVAEFSKEARAGDYDHLLQTVMGWVDVS